MANLGSLIADLGLNTARFEKGIEKAEAGLSQFQRRMAGSFRSLSRQAGQLKTAIAAIVSGAIVKSLVDEFTQAERAAFQLEARLKSTGGAAGFNADQLQGMARALEKVTVFGDDAIIEMQSMLLVFDNLRGPQFVGAQTAVLNMATALGTDLSTAALQVGKAMQDPIEGASALSRAGVRLTQSQKDLIESLVEGGRVGEAQGVILAQLEKQYGGSAVAAAQGMSGAIKQLNNAFGNLQETIVKVVTNGGKGGLVQWLTEAVRAIDVWVGRSPSVFVALFGAIDKAVSYLSASLQLSWAYLTSGFDYVIDSLKSALAGFLEGAATGLEFIPGMDSIAKKTKDYAGSLRDQITETESLELRLKKINDEYDRQARIIDRTVQGMVDKQQLEETNLANFEKTTGADSTAKAITGGGIIPDTEKLEADLERLRNSLLDRETIEVDAWFNRQAILDGALSNSLLSQETHKQLTENLEKFHQDKITKIAMDGATDRQKFMALSARQQTSQVLNEMLALTNGVAQSNKTLFKINQAAGIANAIVNTYQGVSKSLATYPWPLAGIMAGLHLAAGLQTVNSIRSQSFTGGGGASPSISGSTGATGSVATTSANPNQGIDLGGDGAIINVVVNLNDQAIIDAMQRASRDGRLVIQAEAAA